MILKKKENSKENRYVGMWKDRTRCFSLRVSIIITTIVKKEKYIIKFYFDYALAF